jgi:hypothetical protein
MPMADSSSTNHDDESFLRQFEACTLPMDKFHHREHVKVAYLYLRNYPWEEAVERVRGGIMRYNAAHQVPDALDRGYHETITQAWLRLVHFTLSAYGPANSADEFYEQHPQLWQTKVLRLFYSRELMLSWEAKARFVEPDLTKLPEHKPSPQGK